MRTLMRIGGTFVGLAGLAGAAAVAGRIAFARQMAGEIDALLTDARPVPTATVTEADLELLPEPVRRWLRHSQVVGEPRPRTVRLRQAGCFHMEERGWLPYQAEQYFTTNPPGFLWKASFRLTPLVSVVGRDSTGTARPACRCASCR